MGTVGKERGPGRDLTGSAGASLHRGGLVHRLTPTSREAEFTRITGRCQETSPGLFDMPDIQFHIHQRRRRHGAPCL